MFCRIACIAFILACHAGPPAISNSDGLPGIISGRVENAYTGELVAGARVQVREHGEAVESDPAGNFVLPSVPPGTHRVTVQALGFLSGAQENVMVQADGETVITLRVFPADPTPTQQEQWLQRRERRESAPPANETEPEARGEPGEVGSITQALGGPALPETIRVWRSQGTPLAPSRANDFADRSCEGDVLELDFEEYVKGVIPHEWIPSWHPEALRAGAIAARSYAASHALGGGRWRCADVDDGTVTQVYRDDRAGPTDEAVDATRGLTVVRGSLVVRAEYSAENSHPTATGIDDPVCAGSTLFGHGRGACQWGTQRWATSTCFAEPCDFGALGSEPKDHLWMLDHYFPGTEVCAHVPELPCPLLPAEGGVIDDATSCFEAFGPSRYWRREDAGIDGGLHWTNAFESDTPSNWARWEIRAGAAGSFDVAVYIDDDFASFERARYVLRHAGEEETLLVDMGAARDGWLELGRFDFDGAGDEHLSLHDNYDAPLGDNVQLVADAIRIFQAGTPTEDAGSPDAGVADAAPMDSSLVGAESPAEVEAGCGCSLAGRTPRVPAALVLLTLLVGLQRRKSRL